MSKETVKILSVEDSEDIAFGIKEYLSKRNFELTLAGSIAQAKKKLNEDFDLIILDINLPDGDGRNFLKYIKTETDTPVIFLTVKNDEKNIVEGLDLGAEDYITKPFKLSILHSRINAVLRRTKHSSNEIIVLGEYKLDKNQKRLFKNEKEIELSLQEFNLMLLFMENANQTLTRPRLLELIWDSKDNFVNDNTLTATVRRLRQKLDEPLLKTIHGIGYRFEL